MSFARLRTRSPVHSLHKPASGHPDIGQRRQRDELSRVFSKTPVAHSDMPDLALYFMWM